MDDKTAEHCTRDAEDYRNNSCCCKKAFTAFAIPDALEQPQKWLVRRIVLASGELWLVLVVELPGDSHVESLPFKPEISKVVRDLGSVSLEVFAECSEIGRQAVRSGHNEGDSDTAIVLEMLDDYLQITKHPITRLWFRQSGHTWIEKYHGGLWRPDHRSDIVRVPFHTLAHVLAKDDVHLPS